MDIERPGRVEQLLPAVDGPLPVGLDEEGPQVAQVEEDDEHGGPLPGLAEEDPGPAGALPAGRIVLGEEDAERADGYVDPERGGMWRMS